MTVHDALKPGWRRVKFGDVVRLSKVRSQNPLEDGYERYVGLEHLEPGDLRVRSWGNVADGTTFTNVFKPGQVLFGKRRAYQRKVAVTDFAGICSGDIYVFESKDSQDLLPALLPFICQTEAFTSHAVVTSAGSLSPRTNWTSLSDFTFLLPPIYEQIDIIKLLETIEYTKDCYRKSLFEGVVAKSIAQAEMFSEILSNPLSSLSDFAVSISDKGYSGLPILSVTIDGEVVRRESLGRQVVDETGEEKYQKVITGDLVYNTMRLWQGAIGIARESGLVSPAYTVLRPVFEGTSEFLWYLFRSSIMIEQYRRFVKGVAKDRWRIYYSELGGMRISLPTEESMKDLGSTLCSIDKSVGTIHLRIQQLENLRDKILLDRLSDKNVQ